MSNEPRFLTRLRRLHFYPLLFLSVDVFLLLVFFFALFCFRLLVYLTFLVRKIDYRSDTKICFQSRPTFCYSHLTQVIYYSVSHTEYYPLAYHTFCYLLVPISGQQQVHRKDFLDKIA